MSICRLLFLSAIFFAGQTVSANQCAAPGVDGDQTITGIVNTYYEPTSSLPAGSTSVSLGASSGAGESFAANDLALLIQMQDADINTSNSVAYGDGINGRGASNINSTGLYEFISIASVAGATINFSTATVNSYNLAASSLLSGQKTYQIIKVPQYQNLTLNGNLTAPAWDGAKGGVFVIDVAGNLTGGNATVDLNGLGFRAGAYRATGVGTNATQRFFYVADDASNTAGNGRIRHAGKGEGIAGTPQFVYDGNAVIDTNGGSTADGYPQGDYARGAPGNAGGGGNEWNNGNDSGGGGGANFSDGGQGGTGWNLNSATQNVGGLGGGAFSSSIDRIIFGGGGGAGLANNANAPHGGNGGGIIIVRTNSVTGSATFSVNGVNGVTAPTNDGAGGAGAGGSIVALANSGLGGLTLNAAGGDGGDSWLSQAGAGAAHGPGGGGSGGYVIFSSGAGTPTTDISAGQAGATTTGSIDFGSTDGVGGSDIFENVTYPCAVDLAITKTDGQTTYTPGESSTYTLTVENNGPIDIVGAVLSDTVPDGLNIDSVTCTPTANCSSINTTGQLVTVSIDLLDGQSVDVDIAVTYSVLDTDY